MSSWINQLERAIRHIDKQHTSSAIADTEFLLFRMEIGEILWSAYRTKYEGTDRARLFGELIRSILSKLPEQLLRRRPNPLGGKRLPSLVETVGATLHRLDWLEQLLRNAAINKPLKGIILGGSVSYGAFYSVRGGSILQGSSDIDLLLIGDDTPEPIEMTHLIPRLTENPSALAEISHRLRTFAELCKTRRLDCMSHKAIFSGVEVSLHRFSWNAFCAMVGLPFFQALSENQDRIETLLDYRARPFPYAACAQRSFHGTVTAFPVATQELVSHGYVVPLTSYAIQNGMCIPGIYHNLILPRSHVWYDRDGEIERTVMHFMQRLRTRVVQEGMPPSNLFSAHTRSDIFNPTHVLALRSAQG